MKILQYLGYFDENNVKEMIIATFPEWRIEINGAVIEHFGEYYNVETNVLTLYVPDNADENALLTMLQIFDPSSTIYSPTAWEDVVIARQNFLQLPNWAIWNAQEASNFVSNDILGGMSKLDIEAWVENNVNSLATAKTALKLIGGELVDLREICAKLAVMIVCLRTIAVERRE